MLYCLLAMDMVMILREDMKRRAKTYKEDTRISLVENDDFIDKNWRKFKSAHSDDEIKRIMDLNI